MPPDEVADMGLARAKRSSSIHFSVVIVLLFVSCALNVVMAQRLRTLTYARSARIAAYQLSVGTIVPPIQAKRVGRDEETISYEGTNQPTILYVFSPDCVWCARNLDNFKKLLSEEGDRYRFVALSLSKEGLPEYVEKNGLNLPVFFDLSARTREAYKLSGTPQTIVVSPDGRVLQDWVGAYAGDQQGHVERFFHVRLPGLRELPEAKVAEENNPAAVAAK